VLWTAYLATTISRSPNDDFEIRVKILEDRKKWILSDFCPGRLREVERGGNSRCFLRMGKALMRTRLSVGYRDLQEGPHRLVH
jgi:hypothetical protein